MDYEEALPPLRPAACFWARLPPLPEPLLLLLWLLPPPEPPPERLPPLLEASDVLAIAAARDLLMPFLRRPSYCLSSLTLLPWSFAMACLRSVRTRAAGAAGPCPARRP